MTIKAFYVLVLLEERYHIPKKRKLGCDKKWENILQKDLEWHC